MPQSSRRRIFALLLALFASTLPLATPTRAQGGDITVTSNADSGSNTLRAALTSANAAAGSERVTIRFNMANSQIDVTTALPPITRANITIEGRNGAGPSAPRVVLAGAIDDSGIVIQNTSGAIIRDLIVRGFGSGGDNGGIKITGASATGNLVEGVLTGAFDNNGNASIGVAGNLNGVFITSGADNNIISSTIALGNSFAGIRVARSTGASDSMQNNQIRSSLIGVDGSGTVLANTSHGIAVNDFVESLLIGGDTPAERNVIVGHAGVDDAGISVTSSGTNQGTISIRGNYIGLKADGATAGANTLGILAQLQVGRLDIRNNLISANAGDGILLSNYTSPFSHTISGNTIGLTAAGAAAGNGDNGIRITVGSGVAAGGSLIANNVIGGNSDSGIVLANPGVRDVRLEGNIIGLNPAADATRPNVDDGVLLTCDPSITGGNGGPSGTIIGANNTISGNGGSGVRVQSGTNTQILNNSIGLRPGGAAGASALGNKADGVTVISSGSACSGQVPSAVTIQGNTIAGNGTIAGNNSSGGGVGIDGDLIDGVIIRNNVVGLSADQITAVANVNQGIEIRAANNTLIEGNTVAGNGTGATALGNINGPGIVSRVFGGTPTGTIIRNNTVGLAGRGNGGQGILMQGTSSTVALGATIGPNNTVTSNLGAGVQVNQRVNGVRITENVIFGNGGATPNNLLLQGTGSLRANSNIQAPVSLAYDAASDTVSGSATLASGAPCGAGACRIEIFGSDTNTAVEAKVFVAAGLSAADGSFSINVAGRGSNRYLRATTTELAANDTSPFSAIVDAGNSSAVPTPALDVAFQPNQTAPAGGTAVFTHTLTNVGSASGTFELGFSVTPGASVSADPAGAFSLANGASRIVTFTVTLPAGAAGGAVYTATVRAFQQGNPANASVERADRVTVAATRGFDVAPPERSGGPVAAGSSIDYSYFLTNTGNITENFGLSFAVISGEPGVNVVPSEGGTLLDGKTVGPNSAVPLNLRVLVPANATQSSATTVVTVTLAGVGSRTITQTTSIDLRPAPQWSPAVDQVTPPNTPVTATLTLTNAGQIGGTITVTASPASAPGWAYRVEPELANAPFAVGSARPVTVVVTPTNLISGTLLELQLTATPDQGTPATVNVRTRVGPVAGFAFGPTPLSSPGIVAPNGSVSYTHFITNSGNFTETFNLTSGLIAGEPNLAVSLPGGTSLTVPPFASRPVTVTVAVSGTATGAFATTRVTATATSGLQPVPQRFVEQITNIQQVPQPQWTPPADTRLTPPLAPVTYSLTLSNSGLISGSFSVAATAPPTTSWSFSVSPASFVGQTLNPGQAQQFTLVVTPTDSQALSGTTFVVTLDATTAGGPSAQATLTTQIAQVAGLEFTGPGPLDSAPGQIVTFTNQLTNTGNGQDTFSFSNPGTIAGLTSVQVPPPLTLGPRQSAPVVVTYTIAAGAPAGSYSRSITATSQASPTLQASVVNSVNVQSIVAPGIDSLPAQNAAPGGVVTFTHTVSNVGNAEGTIAITRGLTLPPGVLDVTISPASVTLGALESEQVQVVVQLAAGAPAGQLSIPITATAGGASVSVNDLINIAQVAGVDIGPASEPTQAGLPGVTLTYSHVLTNTGNGADTFTVSVAAGLPIWPVSPPRSVSLGAGLTTTVEVTTTVPAGALANTPTAITVFVVSQSDPSKIDNASSSASALPSPGVTILPESQSGVGRAGDTVVYSLVVSNSGNITDSYTLTRTNTLTWTTVLAPLAVGPLGPGQALTVTLETTIPEGTPDDVFSVATITATGSLSPTAQATATVTTTAGRLFDLLFTKDESAIVSPGDPISYTHRLTNTGLLTDSFVFRVAPGLNWPARVFPDVVQDLAPGASVTVTLRLSPPRLTAATRTSAEPIFPPDQTLLQALSVNDARISGQVQDTTTVRQVAGLDFSPRRARSVQPGETVSLQHTLTNRGNGFDSFNFSYKSSLNWPVTLTFTSTPSLAPAGIAGFNSAPTFALLASVRVPANALRGDINTLVITATSQLDGQVFVAVVDSLAIPLELEEQPTPPARRWLPLVLRAGSTRTR
jgi:hypothetical protein